MKFEYSVVIKRADGSVKIVPVEFSRVLSSKSIKITPQLARQIVRVTFPIYVSRARAIAFLESKKDWVAEQLERAPDKIAIADGATIPFMGQKYRVAHIPNARRGVWTEGGYIFVSGDARYLNRRVKDFVKSEIKKYFTAMAKAYAKKLAVHVNKVSVKDTVSRWGSCASTGNLSFSWRLAFAPVWVADYIVAHEVAHLSELNHSYRFWRVVRRIYDGDVDKAQKWLARNGLSLYAIE
ncbi:MAG: M48 family metallopeptidase [Rickettsiales bacterium]|jgi:predicted metal-dependent hydrolase|nr:M48 family metallopeptidase [Rickettsiales bacterium]